MKSYIIFFDIVMPKPIGWNVIRTVETKIQADNSKYAVATALRFLDLAEGEQIKNINIDPDLGVRKSHESH